MKTYEKPLILASEEIAEGVYTASGSTSGSSKCKSKYMKVFFKEIHVASILLIRVMILILCIRKSNAVAKGALIIGVTVQ